MSRCFRQIIRRFSLTVACLAVLSKLLIPVGYMPASWGSGSPIELCPSGLLIDLSGHTGHHDKHGDNDGSHQWEHCPFGALAASPAIPSHIEIQLPELSESFDAVPNTQYLSRATVVAFHSRAPPHSPAI